MDGPGSGRASPACAFWAPRTRRMRPRNPVRVSPVIGSHPARRLLDSAQGSGGISLERRPRALHLLDDLLERATKRRRQFLGVQRRRRLFVDDAARGRFKRRCRQSRQPRRCRRRHGAQDVGRMPQRDGLKQEEETRLPIGEPRHRRQQQRDVEFVLTLDGRGRVPTRRRQVHAIVGTADLDQALGAAADRANRLVQRRAPALGGAGRT